jgi:hypothetical protein
MSSIAIATITAGCTFGGSLIGMWFHSRLPSHHLDAASQEVVKLGSGMLATITALVLGLLVSSAKTTFDTINDGIKQVSAKTILLDRTLAQYGPEATNVREQLMRSAAAGVEAATRREKVGEAGRTTSQLTNRVEAVQSRLRELTPKTEVQRQLFAEANQIASDLSQARWLLMEEAQSELPPPLLVILIAWLAALFMSFGLLAPRNATVLTVLFVSAVSMSAAIFLILEMNRPLDGFIRVSTAPMRNLVEYLGR